MIDVVDAAAGLPPTGTLAEMAAAAALGAKRLVVAGEEARRSARRIAVVIDAISQAR